MMRKIGIITHYDVHNHGALLQLTALIKILKSKGIEAKALQFDKNYDYVGLDLKAKYVISAKSISIYIKSIKDRGMGWFRYNYLKRKTLKKYKFSQDIIGDYYSESPILDAVIIGSDEVFALHTGPTPVFFGYCLPSNKVVSYAGSFGPTTLKDIQDFHAVPFVKGGLESMESITVRDENSANIVESLIGIRPNIVVDPVLLYGYKDEIKTMCRPIKERYLLVYAYDNRMNNLDEVNAIKDYAKLRGLKIISPGFYHAWCDKNIDVDPIKLLGWFKYAEEVLTDTFHGSVMSLITGAKFAVKTRPSNHFKLYNLLKEYGLTNRIFTDWSNVENTMTPEIDYSIVNLEIDRRRNFSVNSLKNMLGI